MPSVTPAGVTSYKVWMQVCLHHEKKISRRSYEIITWESRRSYVWFCVADSHQSSPPKIQGGRQRDQLVQQARGMREWPARWRPGNGIGQRATREQARLAHDRGTAPASARPGNRHG